MKNLRHYFLLFISLILFHLVPYGQTNHRIKSVDGSTNNKLEVLDWGGKGQAILFLAGLGNTAHVYDDFAPKFTNKYHVYGLSRRGYGASQQTTTGYSIDTLTKDILSVVDALGIDKVILIGHSIAGDEITSFASRYLDRVLKVVYLDAAYDHSNLEQLPLIDFHQNSTKDSLSVQDLNDDNKKMRGFVFPGDELEHQFVFSSHGFRIKQITPPTISRAVAMSIKISPDYKGLKCEALAIYAQRNTAQQWFAAYPYMDLATQQKAVNEFMPKWKKYYAAEINRFRNETVKGKVEEIPNAGHYVFLTNPNETERLIRVFLK
jgi:non-heme chloroperoxidase